MAQMKNSPLVVSKDSSNPNFAELRFGKTSAERESEAWPDLLIDGFFDPYKFATAAKQSGPFIFLGYKGSGKSAIGEHLRLSAANDPTSFVRYLSLGDFPYTPFSKIIKGDIEPEAKYPIAWSWLLLLQILDQLTTDMGSSLQGDQDVGSAVSELRSSGLLPSQSLSHIIQITNKRGFSLNLKWIGRSSESLITHGTATDIPFLVEKLKEIVLSVQSQSKHLLIIDGLEPVINFARVVERGLPA